MAILSKGLSLVASLGGLHFGRVDRLQGLGLAGRQVGLGTFHGTFGAIHQGFPGRCHEGQPCGSGIAIAAPGGIVNAGKSKRHVLPAELDVVTRPGTKSILAQLGVTVTSSSLGICQPLCRGGLQGLDRCEKHLHTRSSTALDLLGTLNHPSLQGGQRLNGLHLKGLDLHSGQFQDISSTGLGGHQQLHALTLQGTQTRWNFSLHCRQALFCLHSLHLRVGVSRSCLPVD
mmetsp:Transcript_145379/g.205792  ORF Transcript_145379/g.205792 Transcript_145379/m.205792 type:complete len:230 (+) Transcript_145379:583-1272(+)